MAIRYGHRTRDAAGVVTLDTSTSSVRSLNSFRVTCNGSFEQNFSLPVITSGSFVVVDTIKFNSATTTWSPQAWYSNGNLLIRRGGTETWQVSVLSNEIQGTASGQYGLRSRNDSIVTQIDSVNRALNVLYKGSFTFYGFGNPTPPGWVSGFDFPVPITTYERPFVFINTTNGGFFQGFYVLGSPGNWTGWRVARFDYPSVTGIAWGEQVTVQWFVASYSAGLVSQGAYGERVRDAAGADIFSTTNDLCLMLSQPHSNEFVVGGPSISGVGFYWASSQMSWTGNTTDYILANALLSYVYVDSGSGTPYLFNAAGWYKGNRSIVQAWTNNSGGVGAVYPNGRTLFAAQPMKPI